MQLNQNAQFATSFTLVWQVEGFDWVNDLIGLQINTNFVFTKNGNKIIEAKSRKRLLASIDTTANFVVVVVRLSDSRDSGELRISLPFLELQRLQN